MEKQPHDRPISHLNVTEVTDAKISEATSLVFDEFKKLGATDAVAKSADFLSKLATRIGDAETPNAAPVAAAEANGDSDSK